MNPQCEEVRELLLEWPYLEAHERQRAQEHLASCAECRAFFEEEQAFRGLMQQWRSALEVNRFRWSRVAVSLMATLALLVGILATLMPRPQAHRWGMVHTRLLAPAPTPVVVTVGEGPLALQVLTSGVSLRPVRWVQVLPQLPPVSVRPSSSSSEQEVHT